MTVRRLDQDFDRFWGKIAAGKNFSLVRHGDGEQAIMKGEATGSLEGWTAPSRLTKLGEDMLRVLETEADPRFFFGVDGRISAWHWYVSRIKNRANITFSDIFVNANYRRFLDAINSLDRDAVLIANHRAAGVQKIGGCRILKHYPVTDDCIDFWESGKAHEMIEEVKRDFGDRKNLLFMISTGPTATCIVHALFKHNPDNCYIDTGSAIDEMALGLTSRAYMRKDHKYGRLISTMEDPETDISVTAVMTLFKRPETLAMQLDAIERQTLKPAEILLFQDGGSSATIPDELRVRLTKVEISHVNVGVWGRFKFALGNAKSTYVCMFDDDTIPGERWLENCRTQMQEQEGIYSTIGIKMVKPRNYPRGCVRFGWDNPNKARRQVDFGGHAWFFKRAWLPWMFMDNEDVRALKICGEDMSLSCQCLKYGGIKTFVPPHPRGDTSLWGSLPSTARKLGDSDVGISNNKENKAKYNLAVCMLLDKGWQPVFKGHVWRYKLALIIGALIPYGPLRRRVRGLLFQWLV